METEPGASGSLLPGAPEPGQGQGIYDLSNKHVLCFPPLLRTKRFCPDQILAKDKTVHRNVAERGSFASNVKSAKGKKKNSLPPPSLTVSRSSPVITQCCWWFCVVFFFLQKQCHLPLLLRMLLGESAKTKSSCFGGSLLVV